MELKLLAQHLLRDLDKIEKNTPTIYKRVHLSILLCRRVLAQYRAEIIEKGFSSVQDEIVFFKHTKQIPLSRLIYYKEVHYLEAYLLKSSKLVQKKNLKKQLNRYHSFFLKNMDFVQYIETEQTHLDDYYFTRKSNKELPIMGFNLVLEDPDFNTPKDVMLAQFKAYRMAIEYVNEVLCCLANKNGVSSKKSSLTWTGSFAAFVELSYGLKTVGCLNNGQVEIKKIIEELSVFLGVTLGNYSRTYNELKMRKNSRVKFLDEICERLLQKMDDEDR